MKKAIKTDKTKKERSIRKLSLIGSVIFVSLIVAYAGLFSYTKSKNLSGVHLTPAVQAFTASSPVSTPSATLHSPAIIPPATTSVGTSKNYGFAIPVLTYHYIGNNPKPNDTARNALEVVPEKFEAQMNYLEQNGYTPISPETLYAIFNKQTKVTKPVMLTFDDGYVDFYLNAFPILAKHHFQSVAFIPTGLIGTGYYMNWGQIKQIQSSGLVSFEDHTISHPNLTTMSYEEILRQFKESRNTLQAQTGAPVNFVAYPYGASNNLVYTAAEKAGFIGGFGTWAGRASGPGINMPRLRITGQMSLQEFISRL